MSIEGHLEMVLGNNVVRAALRSDLAESSDAGLEMHIAMANPLSIGQKLRVRASTEAWDALRVWCSQNAHTNPGATASAKAAAAAAGRTERRISDELERLGRRPAYVGKAMVGTQTDVLPARRCGTGRWWPTTRMARANSDGSTLEVELAILRPYRVMRGGRVFTAWAAEPVTVEA